MDTRSDAPPRLELVGTPTAGRRGPTPRPVLLGITVLVLAGVLGLFALDRNSTAELASSAAPSQQLVAEPAALALTAAQLGTGFTQHVIAGGTRLKGRATLNVCGMTFASEAMRVARLENVYRRTGDPTWMSNEVVRYQPGGAQEALSEVRYAVAHCPQGPTVDPATAVEAVFTPAFLTLAGLPRDASSWRISVKLGSRTRHIVFAYEVRGDYLSGIYVYGPDFTSDETLAARAARMSAHNLMTLVPPSNRSVPSTPAHLPAVSESQEIRQFKQGFVSSCGSSVDAQLRARLSRSQLAKSRAMTTAVCTCAVDHLEKADSIGWLLRQSIALEEHKETPISGQAQAAVLSCESMLLTGAQPAAATSRDSTRRVVLRQGQTV
jgi:hypothetical protein